MKVSILKKWFYTTAVISGISLLLFNGCGGSSGGSSTPATGATLDKSSIQRIAQRVIAQGDCIAISDIPSLTSSAAATSMAPSSATSTSSISGASSSVSILPSPIIRGYTFNDRTINGLIGGKLVIGGNHNDGTDTYNYSYQNFTNPAGNSQYALNGSASVVDHGKPGDFGPIMSNKTAKTNGAIGVDKSTYRRNTTGHYELTLSGYNQTYSKVLFTPDELIISSASIKNTNTKEEYKLSNLRTKGFFNSDSIALIDAKGSYTDPELGTMTITADTFQVSLNVVKLPTSVNGTISAKASDGTTADFVISNNGNVKIYSTTKNTKVLISEMDCAALLQ